MKCSEWMKGGLHFFLLRGWYYVRKTESPCIKIMKLCFLQVLAVMETYRGHCGIWRKYLNTVKNYGVNRPRREPRVI